MSVNKEEISAFMDGELADGDSEHVARALCGAGDAYDTWRRYHHVGDAIRGTAQLSADFARRTAARLADEPVVFAPRAMVAPARGMQRFALPVAATVAAVSLVSWLGWQSLGLQPPVTGVPAQASAPGETRPTASTDGQGMAPGRIPASAEAGVPRSAQDYLFAHEVYSPRAAIQGVMPYVRAVSDPSPRAQTR